MAAMGLLPGSLVLLLRRGSFGGPLHVRIGATELMIRRQDAGSIRIADAHRVAA
jgi:ferrous iron transport protein A